MTIATIVNQALNQGSISQFQLDLFQALHLTGQDATDHQTLLDAINNKTVTVA